MDALENFLIRYYSPKGGIASHVKISLVGGRYYIPDDKLNMFYTLYSNALKRGCELFLAERPKEISAFWVDIDFDQEQENRIYTEEDCNILWDIIQEIILEFLDVNTDLESFLMEKEKPKSRGGGIYKDGIHLMFPTIIVDVEMRYFLLCKLYEKIESLNAVPNLREMSDPDNFVDKRIVIFNGMSMFGSIKETLGSKSYVYENTRTRYSTNTKKSVEKLVRLFSLRLGSEDEKVELREKYNNDEFKETIKNILTNKGHIKKQISTKTTAETIKKNKLIREDKSITNSNNKFDVGEKIDIVHKLIRNLSEKRATDNKTWQRVVFFCRNYGLCDLAHEFSSKCMHKYETGGKEATNLILNSDKTSELPVTLSSLYYWSKIDNPQNHARIIEKNWHVTKNITNTAEEYLKQLLTMLPPKEFISFNSLTENVLIILDFYLDDLNATYETFNYYYKKYNNDNFCLKDEFEEKMNFLRKMYPKSKDFKTVVQKCKSFNFSQYYEIEKLYSTITPATAKFNREDPFTFKKFIDAYQGTKFPDEKTMINMIKKDIGKVFCRIQSGGHFVIMKGDPLNILFEIRLYCDNFTPLYFFYGTGVQNDKIIYKKIKFPEFIIQYQKYVPYYLNMVCEPNNTNSEYFNTWEGYKALLVPEVNMDLVNPILDLILTVWCSNNVEYYNYFLTWLYYLIARPEIKTEKCIFGYSHEQGTGKSTLWDFLVTYVLGKELVLQTSGIESVTQKHNQHLSGKKLVIVNEASCTKDVYMACWDKMKSLITDSTIHIEPKGQKSYQVANLLNFVVLSNHQESIRLESAKERRYWCLEVSEIHCQDIKYFEKLRKTCFNNNAGNHFYTYIMNFKLITCIIKCPETELKTELVSRNEYPPLRFLRYLKEQYNHNIIEGYKKEKNNINIDNNPNSNDCNVDLNFDDYNNFETINIKLMYNSKELYEAYLKWSTDEKEKFCTKQKFLLAVTRYFDKGLDSKNHILYRTDKILL